MTKLTIQQQILSWLGMYRDNLPIEAVHKLQDLLELQPQEEKPAIMPIGNKMPADIFNNEQSILQKLRAELERLKEEWTYPFYNEYTKGQIETLCIVVSLLNELETQPEEPAQEWKPREADIIEVSNDGVVWQERVFSYMGTKKNYFWCMYNKHLDKKIGMYEVYPEGYPKYRLWTYARPAPEELKLEKLPEYIARPEDMDEFSATYDVSETQLERLTTTVNLLIDKLNNK